MRPLIISMIILIAAIAPSNSAKAQQKSDTDGLDKTKVCMVDDEYKGEQQLITVIDNKKYYGCCDPCIEILNTDSSFRYAVDPYSGKKIDKSKAYIVRKTGKSDAVIYFENKKNYLVYINKNIK